LYSAPPSPPALYPLSLHDALPISARHGAALSKFLRAAPHNVRFDVCPTVGSNADSPGVVWWSAGGIEPPAEHYSGQQAPLVQPRSEEHTSELQSRGHLVCRLLLEK